MQTLPNSDKTNTVQKALALILMVAVVWGAIKLINPFLDDVVHLMRNIWWLIILGTPLLLLGIYIVSNPLVIWGFFKTLSWNLTKWLIKMDPLSVMDRYADYLSIKLSNLNKTKIELAGKKEKLGRLIKDLEQSREENLKRGVAAQKQGEMAVASLAGTKAATDAQSLQSYKPIYIRLKANVEFLDELGENWDISINKLRYTIDRKRTEYETLREMAKALGQAQEFAKGDTDASKLYNESVKQLEEQVGQKIAYIEDFEKRSKGILSGMKVEKQMLSDEGLAAIEDYKNSGDLLLPDFSVGPIDVDYQEVPNTNKFKFLKNK